ncbi:hypothetical protein IEQ34_014780 [Dendrobium chrysotoxum]|uniref:Uncharacterized protein n=1 Tax=Dendrobium chrysotoxum TaxID=161865 RepID=A0AAV7GMY1_DENCH|nr:hypothetical protein IEQ34_014780 [Dendrobium chrysotoxum]
MNIRKVISVVIQFGIGSCFSVDKIAIDAKHKDTQNLATRNCSQELFHGSIIHLAVGVIRCHAKSHLHAIIGDLCLIAEYHCMISQQLNEKKKEDYVTVNGMTTRKRGEFTSLRARGKSDARERARRKPDTREKARRKSSVLVRLVNEQLVKSLVTNRDESPVSLGGQTEVRPSVGGPAEVPTSVGNLVEVWLRWWSSGTPGVRWWSGGTPGVRRWSGVTPMFGGGPTELRAVIEEKQRGVAWPVNRRKITECNPLLLPVLPLLFSPPPRLVDSQPASATGKCPSSMLSCSTSAIDNTRYPDTEPIETERLKGLLSSSPISIAWKSLHVFPSFPTSISLSASSSSPFLSKSKSSTTTATLSCS